LQNTEQKKKEQLEMNSPPQQQRPSSSTNKTQKNYLLFLLIVSAISYLSFLLVRQWSSLSLHSQCVIPEQPSLEDTSTKELSVAENVSSLLEKHANILMALRDHIPSKENAKPVKAERAQLANNRTSSRIGRTIVPTQKLKELLEQSRQSLSEVEVIEFLGRQPTREEQLLIADYVFEKQREKAKYWIQKIESGEDVSQWDVFTVYEPIVSCETVNRIGRKEDGGKWLCDAWKLIPTNLKRRCVVYSWGSKNEPSFEEDLIGNFGCVVHTFDPTQDVPSTSPNLPPSQYFFHSWGLGPDTNGLMTLGEWPLKTLTKTMEELGHQTVDIQKIDCERCEVNGLGIIFDSPEHTEKFKASSPKMVLLETHASVEDSKDQLFKLIEGLKKLGFYMFYVERNSACNVCREFAFVHADYFLK